MKKNELKKLIKECVKSILEVEEYDPQIDAFSYAPRDRYNPEEPIEPDNSLDSEEYSDEEDQFGYNEDDEINIIKAARDYAMKAGGTIDPKLQQETLSTITAMLTKLLKMHGES